MRSITSLALLEQQASDATTHNSRGRPAGRKKLEEKRKRLEATMDRGSKFYEPTGETTEWEDILVKKGILAPKTKVQEEEEESDDEQVDPREYATLDELDDMEVRPAAACVCLKV
jgi:hypothetical protein